MRYYHRANRASVHSCPTQTVCSFLQHRLVSRNSTRSMIQQVSHIRRRTCDGRRSYSSTDQYLLEWTGRNLHFVDKNDDHFVRSLTYKWLWVAYLVARAHVGVLLAKHNTKFLAYAFEIFFLFEQTLIVVTLGIKISILWEYASNKNERITSEIETQSMIPKQIKYFLLRLYVCFLVLLRCYFQNFTSIYYVVLLNFFLF